MRDTLHFAAGFEQFLLNPQLDRQSPSDSEAQPRMVRFPLAVANSSETSYASGCVEHGADLSRIGLGRCQVFEELDYRVQALLRRIERLHPKTSHTDHQHVEATIVEPLRDLLYAGGTSNLCQTLLTLAYNAEFTVVLVYPGDHRTIPEFEDVQWQKLPRKQNQVQRKEGQSCLVGHATVCLPGLFDAAGGSLRFSGKTVLITGASSGIGRACAARFAQDGASLILTARRRGALEAVAEEVGGASVVEADLANIASLQRFCTRILTETASIDVIVHNAGVGLYAPSYASNPEAVRSLMALNFHAPVEITRRLLPRMASGAAVVTVSSLAGKIPLPGLTVYSASKFALHAFADGLRMEVSELGIHVLNVCPCYVNTPFVRNLIQGTAPPDMPGNRRFSVSPQQCAEAIHAGLRKRKRTIVLPRIGWLVVALGRLFPATLHARMAQHQPGPVSADGAT